MQRTITCRTPTYADLGQLHSDIINYFQNEGTWEIYPKISKGGLTFWVVFSSRVKAPGTCTHR